MDTRTILLKSGNYQQKVFVDDTDRRKYLPLPTKTRNFFF